MSKFFVILLAIALFSTYAMGELDHDCVVCRNNTDTVWCESSRTCIDMGEKGNFTCASGWCNGGACMCGDDCADSFFPCSMSVFGQILLLGVYGVILAYGAKTISDGSELLLEILNPGLIGGLVLPILGAVPDAAIIVVSGMAGTQQDAQNQLAIGVGTLAGSSVMLITITWALSMMVARCDLVGGEAVDETLTKKSLKETGITVDEDTGTNAKIMILSSGAYLTVQVVAFFHLANPGGSGARKIESPFALAGMILCLLGLIAYCTYQVMNPILQKKRMAGARRLALKNSVVKAWVSSVDGFGLGKASSASPATEQSPLLETVKPDVRNIGLKWKRKASSVKKPETLDIQNKPEEVEEQNQSKMEDLPLKAGEKKKIAIKATVLMTLGTIVCAVFSDPMVDVIGRFAKNPSIWGSKGINAFYISFILTPFCSNASELISSLIFASSKKRVNSSLSWSQMYGAVTMNNTLNLGLFFAIVYFRKLTWQYSAETVSVLFCIVCVGLIAARKTTFKAWWAIVICCLYPISLGMCAILEYVFGTLF